MRKKRKISKTLGKNRKKTNKQKDTRTTAKILINDVAKSGLVVSKKQSALHSNGLWGCRPRKTPLLPKKHLQVRLKHVKDNQETDYVYWKCVIWSDKMELELPGHKVANYVWRKKGEVFKEQCYPQRNTVDVYVVSLQCVWNWESNQAGRNHEEGLYMNENKWRFL